jgi:hypothetical protein
MIIIYGSEVLNVYWFTVGIFVIFIPHCEPTLLTHVALYVDVAGGCLRTVDVIVELRVFVKLFVARSGHGIVLVVHHFYQLFVQTI